MNNVWILVCNAARGRLYETNGAGSEWTLVETLEHPQGRSPTNELVTDSAGHGSSLGGSVHHDAKAPRSSPKEVEMGHFVHRLRDALDQGMRAHRFSHLVLVAPPHFLGMLKKDLTHELDKHLLATVDKDYEHMDARGLADKLRESASIPLDQRDVVRAPEKRVH